MSDFQLKDIEVSGCSGIDALFAREPKLVTPTRSLRVASLQTLAPFQRISVDTLIHKSQRDLWSLRRSDTGEYFIERLYDDNGEPLRG